MIFGPDLNELKERAKVLVMRYFVRLAESDGTPPTLRAMYVRKAEQAQLVISGGQSALIAGEAAERGIPPMVMAQVILDMAASAGDQLEVMRMRINVAIDAATDADDVIAKLAEFGLTYSDRDGP